MLVVEAFTHGSFADAVTPSYQRLEFLGDAVCDFLLTELIFKGLTHLTPGELGAAFCCAKQLMVLSQAS